MDQAARGDRGVVGAPDRPPSEDRDEATPAIAASGGSGDQPAAGSLGEALEQALEQAREGQLEQLDADLDLQQVLADAANHPERGPSSRSGRGTGIPAGRMPDRGVDRPQPPTRANKPAATPPDCARH